MNTVTNTYPAWRKYFYSGVGFVAHSRDIVQKSVDEVVKHGSINEAEGKKIVNSTVQKLESSYNEAVHKLSALSVAEIGKLKTRIDKLEKQLLVKSSGRSSVKTLNTRKKVALKKSTH